MSTATSRSQKHPPQTSAQRSPAQTRTAALLLLGILALVLGGLGVALYQRRVTPQSKIAVVTPRCAIKGNIRFQSGEKIYHVPGGEFYRATIISEKKGERWFCTEAEALAAGWRKSKK